jgi:hypothetical protein
MDLPPGAAPIAGVGMHHVLSSERAGLAPDAAAAVSDLLARAGAVAAAARAGALEPPAACAVVADAIALADTFPSARINATFASSVVFVEAASAGPAVCDAVAAAVVGAAAGARADAAGEVVVSAIGALALADKASPRRMWLPRLLDAGEGTAWDASGCAPDRETARRNTLRGGRPCAALPRPPSMHTINAHSGAALLPTPGACVRHSLSTQPAHPNPPPPPPTPPHPLVQDSCPTWPPGLWPRAPTGPAAP